MTAAADLILSCSLCWSGSGDTTDPATGAVVCYACLADLDMLGAPAGTPLLVPGRDSSDRDDPLDLGP
jgi:hypothetical protein